MKPHNREDADRAPGPVDPQPAGLPRLPRAVLSALAACIREGLAAAAGGDVVDNHVDDALDQERQT